MSVVFGCGFARVTVKESFHKPGSVAKETDPDQRWKNYRRLLDESAKAKLAVDRTLYRKKSRTIYDLFRTMSPEKRSEYLQYFSLKNWKALPESQKSEHTMSNCDACQVHHFAMQSFFRTVPSWSHKSWFKMFSLKMQARQTAKVKPTQKDIKSAVKHIYSQIDAPFQSKSALLKLKQKYQSLNFRKRKTRLKKKSERRQRAHQEKQKLEKEWSERDTEMMLVTRQSYSQRARQRKSLYFKTMEEAATRVGKRKRLEDLGERKKKRHSPPPNQVNFDKENLLQEVKNMKDDEKVSWFSVWCIGGLFPEKNIKSYTFKMPLGTMTQHVWEPAPYWGMEEKIIATEAV